MSTGPFGTLVYLTSLPAVPTGDDALVLTRKFIEGMTRYAELWDGPVRCVMPRASTRTDNLDNVECRRHDLPFQVDVMPPEGRWVDYLEDAGLVMASLESRFTPLARWCAGRRLPLIYVAELSWSTRVQIVRTSERRPLRVTRRVLWELEQERRYRNAVALAAGTQCNGTPTFRAYQALSRDALLYFDSRSTVDMLATEKDIQERLSRGRELHLAFSGRLVPYKGADHLVSVAVALRKLGVPFRFSIFGEGRCETEMRVAIERHALGDQVRLEGGLDFVRELSPRIRSEIDLFVCCHRQGDPSCTYLETMACGVPIVGYANEAFAGLLEHAQAGRAVPMGDVQRLAETIAAVSRDRQILEHWALNALHFARSHTFETTFARRMAHAKRVARDYRGAAQSARRGEDVSMVAE